MGVELRETCKKMRLRNAKAQTYFKLCIVLMDEAERLYQTTKRLKGVLTCEYRYRQSLRGQPCDHSHAIKS